MFSESDAVVLRTIPYSDTSLITRLFTKEWGKITVMAKGARRKKNPLNSILEPGSLINIQIIMKENRDIQILKEASFNYITMEIRNNLEKLLTTLSIVDIMDKTTRPMHASPILFRLIYRVIHSLCYRNFEPNIIYWFYLIQLTIQHGFKPNIQSCSKCQNQMKNGILSKYNGELYCINCLNDKEIFLDLESLNFLILLMKTNIDNLGELKTPKKYFNQISFFLEQYMCHHIEGMSKVKSVNISHRLLN